MAEPPSQVPGHGVTNPLPFSWNREGDIFLGVVLTLCTLIGTPTNIIAVRLLVQNYFEFLNLKPLINYVNQNAIDLDNSKGYVYDLSKNQKSNLMKTMIMLFCHHHFTTKVSMKSQVLTPKPR